jgi:DNA invertase Pin-like site-specific DNA recombinase
LDSEGKENPISKMVINLLGVLAEMERGQILERQRQGIAIAKARNVYKGRKTGTKEDVLSFLYVQAELFQKLGENKTAKSILQKIQNIDADYRLTKERLIRLNEI